MLIVVPTVGIPDVGKDPITHFKYTSVFHTYPSDHHKSPHWKVGLVFKVELNVIDQTRERNSSQVPKMHDGVFLQWEKI